jgi:hypothetical protein
MHARNRTWLLGSDPVERCRQRTLPVEGGDGSTLSLDFTTGVLDPRLTFTRTTNATFINSQGLVQYAGQNLYFNTAFGGLSGTNPSLTSSGWTYAFSTGSATFHGDGSVTMTASSQRIGIARSSGFTGAGRRVIASVDILTVGDTGLTPSNLLTTGTFTNSAYYVDSGLYTTGNVIGPCTLSFVFDSPTSGTTGAYFGVGMSFNSTATVKFANPRLNLWNGVVPAPYLGNTSTTAERHDPRFDYDPSTLQPRGLLIEASASNYGTHSESFATSGSGTLWTYSAITKNATLASSPAGNNDAAQLNETTANDIHRISQFVTAAAGAVTISVWAKAIDPSTPRRLYMNAIGFMGCGALFDLTQTGASGTAVNVAGSAANRAGTWVKYPNGWYRCSIVGTYNTGQTLYLQVNRASSTVATDDTYLGSTANGLMLYGFQTELGSGASSYIPTGASTGSRDQDLVSVTLTDFSSWWTSNNPASFLLDFSSTQRPSTNRIIRIADSGGSAFGYSVYFNSSTMPQQVRAVLSSASSSDISIGTNLAANTRTKVGFTIETAALKRFRDGSLASTLSSPSLPPNTMTQMYIGGNPTFGNSSADFCLRSFKYWPTTLADATMQILTT